MMAISCLNLFGHQTTKYTIYLPLSDGTEIFNVLHFIATNSFSLIGQILWCTLVDTLHSLYVLLERFTNALLGKN